MKGPFSCNMKEVSRWKPHKRHFFRWKQVFCAVLSVWLLNFMGVFTHLFEKDYYTGFSYPMEIDVSPLVEKLKNGVKPEELDVQPVNTITFEYLKSCHNKCSIEGDVRVLLVIKSAINHSDRRTVIRETWGFEHRFSDVVFKRIFLLGVNPKDPNSMDYITKESELYGDIVQADFVDDYSNNTLKIMTGFKWAVEHCSKAQYVLFSDDDMYISMKNVLRFIRNPLNYPSYLELPVASVTRKSGEFRERSLKENLIKPMIHPENEDLRRFAVDFGEYQTEDNIKLYSGYVFHSPPQRHRTSKWFVTLEEYPYTLWPPYATAGAFIVSRQALFDLYYTSFYTRFFRFDDVFLGLVARKVGIDPLHCSQFYFWKKDYSIDGYRYVIASHGYDDIGELRRVWNEQKSAGNA